MIVLDKQKRYDGRTIHWHFCEYGCITACCHCICTLGQSAYFTAWSTLFTIYLLKAAGVALIPPLLLLLALTLMSLLEYKGQCSGWMDSGSWPCSLGTYLKQNFFWSCMVALFPSLLGIGMTSVIFIWHWLKKETSSAPKPS